MKYTITINQAGIAAAGYWDRTDLIDWAILEYVAAWQTQPRAHRIADTVWINYRHLISEMPGLGLKGKPSVSNRILKLHKIGLLQIEHDADGRVFAAITAEAHRVMLFGVHENERGVHENERGVHENERGGVHENEHSSDNHISSVNHYPSFCENPESALEASPDSNGARHPLKSTLRGQIARTAGVDGGGGVNHPAGGKAPQPPGFDEFWEIYPRQRRGSREKAVAAYQKAVRRGNSVESIIAGTRAYAGSREVAEGYAKGAAAWLNDDRFLNDYMEITNETNRRDTKLTKLDRLNAATARAIANSAHITGFERPGKPGADPAPMLSGPKRVWQDPGGNGSDNRPAPDGPRGLWN